MTVCPCKLHAVRVGAPVYLAHELWLHCHWLVCFATTYVTGCHEACFPRSCLILKVTAEDGAISDCSPEGLRVPDSASLPSFAATCPAYSLLSLSGIIHSSLHP